MKILCFTSLTINKILESSPILAEINKSYPKENSTVEDSLKLQKGGLKKWLNLELY